jgi:hypothetical protein
MGTNCEEVISQNIRNISEYEEEFKCKEEIKVVILHHSGFCPVHW